MLALTNWKTTAAGAATILTALADMTTAFSHGTISGNLSTDMTAILAGIGLIFAKDATAPTTVAQTTTTSTTATK
jgi:hypothetical protein